MKAVRQTTNLQIFIKSVRTMIQKQGAKCLGKRCINREKKWGQTQSRIKFIRHKFKECGHLPRHRWNDVAEAQSFSRLGFL